VESEIGTDVEVEVGWWMVLADATVCSGDDDESVACDDDVNAEGGSKELVASCELAECVDGAGLSLLPFVRGAILNITRSRSDRWLGGGAGCNM